MQINGIRRLGRSLTYTGRMHKRFQSVCSRASQSKLSSSFVVVVAMDVLASAIPKSQCSGVKSQGVILINKSNLNV